MNIRQNIRKAAFSLVWRTLLFLDKENIECSLEDLEFRHGKHHFTANNPIHIISPKGYFRECRKHEPIRQYLTHITEL